MANITLRGNPIHTSGDLPSKGQKAPDFKLTRTDLKDVTLGDFAGKKKVLNIFPSIDTPVCATSVRRFNTEASKVPDAVILCISADLPFAFKRFCGAEGIEGVVGLSDFRSNEFGRAYGVVMTDGPLAGLLGRSVVVLDEKDNVIHAELVPEIAQEPNYDAALAALKG